MTWCGMCMSKGPTTEKRMWPLFRIAAKARSTVEREREHRVEGKEKGTDFVTLTPEILNRLQDMGDAYWRYGDARQPPMPPPSSLPAAKRSRSDYDLPGGHELPGFYPREEERGGRRVIRDSESLGASYDRYLRNGQMSSYSAVDPGRQMPAFGAGDPGRPMTGAPPTHAIDDLRVMGVGGIDPGMAGKGPRMGYGGGRSEVLLPPDASNTLFVEGLPADCSRREVAHIFRPFVGFKEVRLVNKESRYPGGDPIVLCFVDFTTPSQAAVALDALQGYLFDEQEQFPAILNLQFARFPGPRSGGGPRGKR